MSKIQEEIFSFVEMFDSEISTVNLQSIGKSECCKQKIVLNNALQ